MPIDRITLPTSSGVMLHVRVWTASAAPRGVLQIHHGLGEDGAHYHGLAEAAALAGYHVYAADCRGHGNSFAPDVLPGSLARRDGAARLLADLSCLDREIGRRHGDLPRIAFGNGAGATIATALLAQDPRSFRALVAWNGIHALGGGAWLGRLLVAVERFRLGSDAISPFGRRFLPGLPAGWLPTVAVTRDMIDLIAINGRNSSFPGLDRRLPIHLAGGAGSEAFARRLAALGFARLHFSAPDSGSAAYDPHAREHVAALIAWLDRQF